MGKRNRGRIAERFAALPLSVLMHPAFKTLPVSYQRVLWLLAAQFDGTNNGNLTLTKKQAENFGLRDERTRSLGLSELEARGLIRKTRAGGVKHGSKAPTLWALEWRQIDYDKGEKLAVARMPPKRWLEFEPQQHVTRRQERTPPRFSDDKPPARSTTSHRLVVNGSNNKPPASSEAAFTTSHRLAPYENSPEEAPDAE